MPRIYFNDGQEITYGDLNKIAQAIEKELMDRLGYELMGRQVNCVFRDSFKVSYVGGTSVSVKAGVGVQSDATQVDPEPEKRMLFVATDTTKTLTAADGANPRIDIVCIKANRATVASATRNFKALDGTLSSTSTPIETDWASDLLVVAGTPAGSPAVPATPAGYIKLAELAVAASTGLPSSGGITDKRTIFIPGSNGAAIRTVTAAATATPEDETIFGDCTSAGFTIMLPPAAICPNKILRIMKSDSSANVLTVDGNASELLNDALTQTIEYQYTVLSLLSTGTGWVLL
jgi:hypothetical protein